ncbi:hypothetical protein AVEN_143976-1 [Araneus ventricosus]|uniref:Uncharacterized protein n=1 Tax=Araneus ventricosus TaxID=182803 RepID=A0A4Y2W7U7_ARAVE|nr:hypothetical protein AVEN_143976-1 [Araneus ventricosus]
MSNDSCQVERQRSSRPQVLIQSGVSQNVVANEVLLVMPVNGRVRILDIHRHTERLLERRHVRQDGWTQFKILDSTDPDFFDISSLSHCVDVCAVVGVEEDAQMSSSHISALITNSCVDEAPA